MSSFFPWMGGKSKLAKRLVEILPEHKSYVEVFAGAANVLFAKAPSKSEVINDINSDLVNLFRVVRNHPRCFLEQINYMIASREEFSDLKNNRGLTDIQRAARFWFILKAAFGGRGESESCTFGYGTTGKSRFKRSAMSAIRKCHKRLDGVVVENLDFEEILQRYDRKHTVFFCDPPYLETAGYSHIFEIEDHMRLRDELASLKGKFLLTINDHPEIRKLYRGFSKLKVKTKYTVSRNKDAAALDRAELVIANYKLPGKW